MELDEQQLALEQAHLAVTQARIEDEMAGIHRRFEEGIDAADERSTESVREMLEARFRQLGKIQRDGVPYFGRIDFLFRDDEADSPEAHEAAEAPDGRVRSLYLGKFALHTAQGEALVTDWRAPVANLYYDNAVGPASYRVDNRRIEGDLLLKRKLDIRQFKLIGYDDTDIISADAALLPYLSTTSDVRLKNIIATIQAEQNAIIRQNIRRHLIVQGMAGSGKTTVALHRIAYLVYLHRKDFHPEHFMILSSGGFFLKYISGILPDLGVENVPQSTFEDLCEELLGEPLPVVDPLERLAMPDGPAKAAFEAEARYKSSPRLLEDLDAFISERFSREELGALRMGTARRPKITALYRDFCSARGHAVQRQYEYEDLTPMLYLAARLFGLANRYIRHIVIDEAQDFSPIQLKVLRQVFQTATFTILGDLAQGIYPWRGTQDWAAVNLLAFEGKAGQMYLRKGYRTTVEIVEAANRVLSRFPALPKGTAVLRHGDPVVQQAVGSVDEQAQACARFIQEARQKGYRNIAVITLDMASAAMLGAAVSYALGEPLALLQSRDDQYPGGACHITAALAKGLEFDAAIISDGESCRPGHADPHLLYVAMTRPMHMLRLLYRSDIADVPPLAALDV